MTTSAAIFDQLSIQISIDEDETTLAQSRVLLDLDRISRDVRANCTTSEWCYRLVSMQCAPKNSDTAQNTEYENCKAILDQQGTIPEYKAVPNNRTRNILRVRRQDLIGRRPEEEIRSAEGKVNPEEKADNWRKVLNGASVHKPDLEKQKEHAPVVSQTSAEVREQAENFTATVSKRTASSLNGLPREYVAWLESVVDFTALDELEDVLELLTLEQRQTVQTLLEVSRASQRVALDVARRFAALELAQTNIPVIQTSKGIQRRGFWKSSFSRRA